MAENEFPYGEESYEIKENVLERKKISEAVKADIKNNRTVIYNLNNGIATSFNQKAITQETVRLINQLRLGKDTKTVTNVTTLDNGLLLLTGDSEFILFKKLANNHTLLLLNGKIEEMDRKLESKLLSKLASSEFYSAKNKIIMEHGSFQNGVDRAFETGDEVILLSPACASYDMFSGYEERGKVFKEYALSKK